MQRFIRLVSYLWLGVIALISLAWLYGQVFSLPNNLQALGLELCHRKLCLLGVTPGITSAQEAKAILTERGATIPAQNATSVSVYYTGDTYLLNDVSIHVYDPMYNGASVMTSIQVFRPFDYIPITVGDVLSYLGAPCGMEVESDQIMGIHLILFYPSASIDIASGLNDIADFQVDAYTNISTFWLAAPDAVINKCGSGKWVGLQHYNWVRELHK